MIHTRTTLRRDRMDDPPDGSANWRRILHWEGAAGPLLDQHVVEDTRWIEFMTEVAAEDLVVHKKRLSAFNATDLRQKHRMLRNSTDAENSRTVPRQPCAG